MAYYFHIMQGLRGCYMPDSAFLVRAETRRELKAILRDTVESYANSDAIDSEYRLRFNREHITAAAAAAWKAAARKSGNPYPYVIPIGPKRERPYGVFVSTATRAEFLEYMESEQ